MFFAFIIGAWYYSLLLAGSWEAFNIKNNTSKIIYACVLPDSTYHMHVDNLSWDCNQPTAIAPKSFAAVFNPGFHAFASSQGSLHLMFGDSKPLSVGNVKPGHVGVSAYLSCNDDGDCSWDDSKTVNLQTSHEVNAKGENQVMVINSIKPNNHSMVCVTNSMSVGGDLYLKVGENVSGSLGEGFTSGHTRCWFGAHSVSVYGCSSKYTGARCWHYANFFINPEVSSYGEVEITGNDETQGKTLWHHNLGMIIEGYTIWDSWNDN
ncbi:hypothetical protein [Piscirickettsia litoralis]|uniref:Uncharacterized protein n=1 Tax=Piscirickettsia litoralis TaxID=1891921 RepID=A0ABX3A793_9GAMM|nr:hypothetical protein [Piscirickettsia litoralis]ODN43566.1 hypothetical protein BGC07_12390 [Piscirickettsia litoralis]